MNKILFSILSAFMVSTMASAQYLNVKLKDGTYHSYKTSSDMEVSFGDKKGADVTESGQMIKIYHGDQLVTKYKLLEGDKVVYEEAPVLGTTGSAQRMGGDNIEVNWIQLWEGGPRFAEYNVGAEKNMAEDYGGYYCFGKVTDKDKECTFYNGNRALADDDDTATKLWGSNWRMPTKEEFDALLNNQNCTCTWTTQNGVNGLLCKGKDAYSSNSVFLPAAGNCCDGDVGGQGYSGYYWSSTPDGSDYAYSLFFCSGGQYVCGYSRYLGYSVRAVLNENE